MKNFETKKGAQQLDKVWSTLQYFIHGRIGVKNS